MRGAGAGQGADAGSSRLGPTIHEDISYSDKRKIVTDKEYGVCRFTDDRLIA